MKDFVESSKTGIKLVLYVQPGSSQQGFAGLIDDRLRIRVSGKAVDGAANKSLIEYLARFFGVSKSSVSLVAGAKSRQKVLFIEGHPEALMEKIRPLINAVP